MAGYFVEFWKSVPDEGDRSHEACQERLHVEAGGADEARKRAEAMFCESRGIQDWSEAADRVEVEEQDRPAPPPLAGDAAEGGAGEEPWSHVDT